METLAHQFKGLSDATRLRILNLLAEGELCVCDLMSVLDMPQSTISRHLAYLRNAGWIQSRKSGRWNYHRRTTDATPFQAYAFAMLDDHFSDLPLAQRDRESLTQRLAEKAEGTCAEACA